MSLRINHNIAALNANRNLAYTNSALQDSMERLSSGYRINRGADDPAGLVISEQFRAQIAGLNRAISNSEGSISMIQTAEGAISEINNLLISMRELAIHAANEGFNDADQLAADQAEIDNAIATIDRIAANTQFGTKKLLDGSNANIATITSANSSGVTIKTSYLSDGQHSITATKTADPSAHLNTTSLGLSLANTDGDPYNLAEGIHSIDVVQASAAAQKLSGAVSISDAFGNGLELAAAATVGMLSSSALAQGGGALAANAGTYSVILNYQENGESPTGDQTLTVAVALGDNSSDVASKIQAQINLNTSLAGKVVCTATDDGAIRFKTASLGAQYSVQTKASSDTATTSYFTVGVADARGASANTLSMVVNTATNSNALGVVTLNASVYSNLADIVTRLDEGLQTAFLDVQGDTNISDIDAAVVNDNQIRMYTNDEGSAYSLQVRTIAADSGNAQNVLNITGDSLANTGTDALVRFDGYNNTIDTVKYGSTTDIALINAADGETSQGRVEMTVGTAPNGINLGSLLLDVTAAKFDVRLDGGPANSVTAGVETAVYNADRTESLRLTYALTSQGGTETIYNVDQSLVFQIGANVGQTASIGLRNMAASALGTGLADNMFRSLASIDVTTVQGAQDAQSVVDAAINEVSTTRGTLGSFQKNTLESNLSNLRIAAQNLTAAESQIRDTDMASEMSEFTKYQILVQAGTAMLAQANQVPQVVLSLF